MALCFHPVEPSVELLCDERNGQPVGIDFITLRPGSKFVTMTKHCTVKYDLYM